MARFMLENYTEREMPRATHKSETSRCLQDRKLAPAGHAIEGEETTVDGADGLAAAEGKVPARGRPEWRWSDDFGSRAAAILIVTPQDHGEGGWRWPGEPPSSRG